MAVTPWRWLVSSDWPPLPGKDFAKQIDFSTPQSCMAEMQDCSQGLAYLDHIFGRIVSCPFNAL